MPGITYTNLATTYPLPQSELTRLIDCYRKVFAGPPWNEWYRCAEPDCTAHWGSQHQADLERLGYTHHGQPVQEYWPAEEIEADITAELRQPNASLWVAQHNGTMAGFCLGYGIMPHELEQKLKLTGLATVIEQAFGRHLYVAYQDELGVLQALRRHGLGRTMFALRQADFLAGGLNVGIIRTTPATVTFSWYTTKLGYTQVATYPDGRVVLGRTLPGQ